ncbi:Copia protein, partial [Mucuna pruriens]
MQTMHDRLWIEDPPLDINQNSESWHKMKIILDDLKVKYEGPIKLFCDNNSAISIAHNSIQHDRTKHIEIDRHFIKKKLDSGLIVIVHVPIGLQVTDVFTKGLLATRFQELWQVRNDSYSFTNLRGSVEIL